MKPENQVTYHADFSRTTQPSDEEPLFGGTPFRDAHTDDAEAHDDTNRNYYTLLNIDKDATEEQIRDAYKTMAGAYKPNPSCLSS